MILIPLSMFLSAAALAAPVPARHTTQGASVAERPAAPTGPRAVFEAADGAIRTVALDALDCTDPRSLGGYLVRFEGAARASLPAAPDARARFEFRNGDVLYGRVLAGDGDRVEVEMIGAVKVGVTLDELVSMTFRARIEALWTEAPKAAVEGDRLYRRQRDVLDTIDGGVEEFTPEGVQFRGTLLGAKLIPWAEVAALFIDNTAAVAPGRSAGNALVPVALDLVDSSHLHGHLERLSKDGCRLVVAGGQAIDLPLATLAEIVVDDGALAFLSSLAPSRAVESSPFGDDLGIRWPHRVDLSVTAAPLTAGGRVYARGLGVHAPSRIEWKLAKAWRSMRGAVAIDDQVLRLAARGSVVFRVHADGALRWQSPMVRGGDPPIALPAIDLTGVDELALEVDAGEDSYVADRADWLRMILVR